MSFLRARRTSCSGSPLKAAVPTYSTQNSSRLVKPLRQRSKTVSSATGLDPDAPHHVGQIPMDTNGREANSKANGNKDDSQNGWSRLKLGYDKRRDEARTSETTPAGPPPSRHTRRNDGTSKPSKPIYSDLEKEMRRIAETKAKLEAELREHTEFLRLLRGRREKVAEQGEKLRMSVSPEKRPSTPKYRYTTPDPETPPPSRPPSPSPARRACQEAYAKMSPLKQHLMREQMHCDGIRLRDTRREEEERREWKEYQQNSPQQARSQTSHGNQQTEREARDWDRRRRIQEIQTEAIRLENLWHNREQRELTKAWDTYESCWATLSSSLPLTVRLTDLPWPIMPVSFAMPQSTDTGATDFLNRMFSLDAVSTFLFSTYNSGGKTRKQRLHDALLRYHPDRFEIRWLHRVPEANGERECVRETVGLVARILGDLLNAEQ